MCSLPFPGPFLNDLDVLLTLAVVIVIAVTGIARSPARRSGIRPVSIIIILVDCLFPIQWSNRKQVAWLVLQEAQRLNLCPEIIATLPTETFAGAFNLRRAGCPRIGAID